MKLLSDRKAAFQPAIAGENSPTSAHGESTDQNVNRAGLKALDSAFVVDARRVLVIGVDRLVETSVSPIASGHARSATPGTAGIRTQPTT